jgi:hypothetical protein
MNADLADSHGYSSNLSQINSVKKSACDKQHWLIYRLQLFNAMINLMTRQSMYNVNYSKQNISCFQKD